MEMSNDVPEPLFEKQVISDHLFILPSRLQMYATLTTLPAEVTFRTGFYRKFF
jgi:hypothetical protein